MCSQESKPKGQNMKTTIALLSAIAALTGCNTTTPPRPTPAALPDSPAPVIAQAAKSVQEAGTVIVEAAQKIRTVATVIQARVSDPVAQASAKTIQAETAKIEAQAAPLAAAVAEIQTSVPAVEKIEEAAAGSLELIEAKDQEIAELKERNNGLIGKVLPVFILAGTLVLALSVYLFISGNPKAIGGGIAGGALIIVSMAVTVLTKLTTLFVLLAGLGLVAFVAALAYHGWLYFRQRNGLTQVVQSVELIKQELPADAKARLFGTDTITGAVETVQDPETKKLVKAIRKGNGNA
jgi:hypothetical protein